MKERRLDLSWKKMVDDGGDAAIGILQQLGLDLIASSGGSSNRAR
jgi:hypothetical protein